MKWIHYSRYTGEDLGIGAEDLLQALSDFLLESGFNTQYMPFSEWNQHTLEDLKKAIQQALEQGKLFDTERAEEMMQRSQQHVARADGQAAREPGPEAGGRRPDHHRGARAAAGLRSRRRAAARRPRSSSKSPTSRSTFSASRRSRICSARSANRASARHDTRDLATGVETSGVVEALRIRRHAEPGRQRDAVLGHPPRGREGAARPGLLRPARAPVRISELLRHGADARLQPQHDPLRRGPLHAGQEGGAGAGAPDPHAVSRRQPALRAVPRFGRGAARSASWRACRWARTTPTRATA